MITALYGWVHFEKWTQSRTSEILLGPFAGEPFVGKLLGLAGSRIYRKGIIMQNNKAITSIMQVILAVLCTCQGVHIPRIPIHINSKLIYVMY